MAIVPSEKATVKDFLDLPEGASYELIEGQLVHEPSPFYGHQNILLLIIRQLQNFLEKKPVGTLCLAPLDVHFDEENIFQPDIFFISKENPIEIRKNDWIRGVPDLIVEILSPSNAYYDTQKKLRVYEKYGVKEYFIVDPEVKMVTAYSLVNGKYKELYREEGIIKSLMLNAEMQF